MQCAPPPSPELSCSRKNSTGTISLSSLIAAVAGGLVCRWLRTLSRPPRPSIEPWCLQRTACHQVLLAATQRQCLENILGAARLVAAARKSHEGSEQRLNDTHILHIALLPSRGCVLHRRQRGLSLRWVLTLGLQLRPHLQRNLAQAGCNHTPLEGSGVLQPNLATSVPGIVHLLQHVCILPLLRLGLHCCLHLLHQRGGVIVHLSMKR